MFDISFILPCCNSSDLTRQNIAQLSYVINLCSNIEIVILNCISDDTLYSEIKSYEEKWPDNILIVNMDGIKDDNELIELGIYYSDSLCYMYLPFKIDITDPNIWNNLVANEKACNSDKYKYITDKFKYISLSHNKDKFIFDQINEMPQLTDYKENAGNVDMHYFFQDIYVANKVLRDGHTHIYDIGSRLDGYISHLLAMDIKVTMIDIRPLPIKINNLHFLKGDATRLNDLEADSIPVLSCLHALEHFGLGRYGDTIDVDGWGKALSGFKRIIAPNGYLYLSVPVGVFETVMFNAHRIFNPLTLVSSLTPLFRLCEFTLIHESSIKTYSFTHEDTYDRIIQIFKKIQTNDMGNYDCGIFVFKKS